MNPHNEVLQPSLEPGAITSLTTDEDSGYPDVGIVVGLGGGRALHIGELSKASLEGVEGAEHCPSGWWIAIYDEKTGFRPIGCCLDSHEGVEFANEIAAAVRP